MNIEFIKKLAAKIELPKAALQAALPLLMTSKIDWNTILNSPEQEAISLCLRRIRENKAKGAAFSLAFCLAFSERTLQMYREKGLPEDVFYTSMRDVAIWAKTAKKVENVDGLLEIGWLRQTLYLHMFRIGRMQYQFFTVHYAHSGLSFSARRHAPIPNHSLVLNMHIPEDGRLELSECRASVTAAEQFFKTYYPEYHFVGFYCDSWLLDPKNKDFMAADSNIVRFAELFDCVYSSNIHNREIVKRLWGKSVRKKAFKTLAEDTSLQKRTKAYLLSGGKTGSGYGFLLPKQNITD